MKNYQIGFRNHFIQAWHILVHASVLFLLPWYFKLQYGEESMDFAQKAALVVFLIVLVPHAILHLRYWWVNNQLSIDFKKESISLCLKGQKLNIEYSAIASVQHVESYASANNTLQWFPWDGYSYAKIELNSGEEVVVTSLLVPHLIVPFDLPRKNSVKVFFCWPPSMNLLRES